MNTDPIVLEVLPPSDPAWAPFVLAIGLVGMVATIGIYVWVRKANPETVSFEGVAAGIVILLAFGSAALMGYDAEAVSPPDYEAAAAELSEQAGGEITGDELRDTVDRIRVSPERTYQPGTDSDGYKQPERTMPMSQKVAKTETASGVRFTAAYADLSECTTTFLPELTGVDCPPVLEITIP